MRRLLLTFLSGALLSASAILLLRIALAQPAGGSVNLPDPLTGQEIVSVLPLQGNGQPGAIMANVTIAQIARFAANSTVSTVTTGAVTMTTPTLILSVALTGAVTVTLPAGTTDGQQAVIVNGSGGAFTQMITVSPVAGATDVITTMPAGGSARYQYSTTTLMWTRIG